MITEAKWDSVRPVRSRVQIFAAISKIAELGHTNLGELSAYLLSLRKQSELPRVQALGRDMLKRTPAGNTTDYVTYTRQLVRVLKYAGFIRVDKSSIVPTQSCYDIVNLVRRDELAAEALFLERVLSSRFTTYWLYLRTLSLKGRMRIPRELSKRDRNLARYLIQEGFPVNVVSFYVLRDFFYEFGLVNFNLDENEETIIPMYAIDRESPTYHEVIEVQEHKIYYWREIPLSAFGKLLTKAYLESAGGWDRTVDLIGLRERVCLEAGISERQFSKLLEQLLKEQEKWRIYPSWGEIGFEKRKGYLVKVLSLPKSERGYPYTLMRILREGTELA